MTGVIVLAHRQCDHIANGPVFKLHREPLATITSLVTGFTGKGTCVLPNLDAVSWNYARLFVKLPLNGSINLDASLSRDTCALTKQQRILLALRYWVEWNKLSDVYADAQFQVESVTMSTFERAWCSYCETHNCAFNKFTRVAKRPVARYGHDPSKSLITSWQELFQMDRAACCAAIQLSDSYGYAYDRQIYRLCETQIPILTSRWGF